MSDTAPIRLWNPNAAACWSLFLTPAFGAYLHMRNWEAMNDPKAAMLARRWFQASLAVLAMNLLLGMVFEESRAIDAFLRLFGLAYLLTWYFSHGRVQVRHVQDVYGDDYVRQPWGRVFGYALLGVLAYFGVAFIVGMLSALYDSFRQ
ncbi:hypothetical protein [Massilia sp. TS11]|uniref:hypothetical protein n=1 Tax=Massilia sp. TS11 TaxID=2908003 RepID=UPI001ED9DE9E|nr:hypothetical protein [Massilia sp. TS11]MCG2584282.1 hypothetical protein [Massilia sp. TS11]